jgi:hypothetical protein
VDIVVNVGLSSDQCEDSQRGGRVARRHGTPGLHLVFFESWVYDIKMEDFEDKVADKRIHRPHVTLMMSTRLCHHAAFFLNKGGNGVREHNKEHLWF